MKLFTLAILTFLSTFLYSQTAPDFTLTDTDGVEHNLYADYLDQGKTVMLHVGAQWNPWDSVFMSTGAMQEFHSEFTTSGDAVLLFIDPYSNTVDVLNGSQGGYDLMSAINYPKILADQSFNELYDIQWFPTIRMICPDGSLHSDFENDELSYGQFETAEIIAETFFQFCGTNFEVASISSTLFNDLDGDCIQSADDVIMPRVKMNVTTPNSNFTRFSDEAGKVRFLAGIGDYNLEVCPPNRLWSACSNPQSVTILSEDQDENIYFPLQAIEDCPLLEAEISAPFLRRCFDSYVYVDYCNIGTAALEEGFVEVTLDNFMVFQSSDPMPSSVSGNVLRYELGTVDMWACGKIKITVEIDCESELGDLQCYSVNYGPIFSCDTKDIGSSEVCDEIIGAYDPNDKRAFPLGDEDNYRILPNEEIQYQIRFQNTGTDTAFNIVIEDVISDNVDLATFIPGQSSHDYSVDINDGRKVTFRFDNIMLPDSNVNLQGSNGFINYSIQQVPDLANDILIENEAAIFFDFNDPIWTNKTIHTIDDGISSTTALADPQFTVAPNPAQDWINIELDAAKWQAASAQVVDISGRVILEKEIQAQARLDISDLNDGLYLLKLSNTQGQEGQRLITIAR